MKAPLLCSTCNAWHLSACVHARSGMADAHTMDIRIHCTRSVICHSMAMQMQVPFRLCCATSAASMLKQLRHVSVRPPQPGVVGVREVTREAHPDPNTKRSLTLTRVCCRRSRGWWDCARSRARRTLTLPQRMRRTRALMPSTPPRTANCAGRQWTCGWCAAASTVQVVWLTWCCSKRDDSGRRAIVSAVNVHPVSRRVLLCHMCMHSVRGPSCSSGGQRTVLMLAHIAMSLSDTVPSYVCSSWSQSV